MIGEVVKVRTFKGGPEFKVSRDEGTYRAGELKGIIRINQDACVGCDTCKGVCPADAIEGSPGEKHSINFDRCVVCGQCLLNCPFNAIEQMSFVDLVIEKLKDKNTKVVGIIAPAVRIALAEEFGAEPGTITVGSLWAALEKAGFLIYENNFAADQTIIEEGTELIARIAAKAGLKKLPVFLWGQEFEIDLKELHSTALPQFTSCCPAWVRYAEIYYPELLPNLSSCKSPQQMSGPTAKTYGAKSIWGVDSKKMFTVGIMPCTAKIFEASRPEFDSAGRFLKTSGMRDVDAVLTTRDLAELFKKLGINPLEIPEEKTRVPKDFKWYSGGATIFGTSGGVMEAAVRFAFHVLSGLEPDAMSPVWDFEPVRGYVRPVATATIPVPLRAEYKKALGTDKLAIKLCNVNGIGPNGGHIKNILEAAKAGRSPYHFIEVMCCPGGCLNGGGQPKHALEV